MATTATIKPKGLPPLALRGVKPWTAAGWDRMARDLAKANDQTKIVVRLLLEAVLQEPRADVPELEFNADGGTYTYLPDDLCEAVFLATDEISGILFRGMHTRDEADILPKTARVTHKYGLLLAHAAPGLLADVVAACAPAASTSRCLDGAEYAPGTVAAWNGAQWVKALRSIAAKGNREAKFAAQVLLENILLPPRSHDLAWDFEGTTRVCKRMPNDACKAVAIACDKAASTLQAFTTPVKYEDESPEVVAVLHKRAFSLACAIPEILADVVAAAGQGEHR